MGLPQRVWDINGSHILTVALRACHREYFNHKRWYSIRLQAVVDGRGLFLNVYPGQPINIHHMFVLWQKKEKCSFNTISVEKCWSASEMVPAVKVVCGPFLDRGQFAQNQVLDHKTSRKMFALKIKAH